MSPEKHITNGSIPTGTFRNNIGSKPGTTPQHLALEKAVKKMGSVSNLLAKMGKSSGLMFWWKNKIIKDGEDLLPYITALQVEIACEIAGIADKISPFAATLLKEVIKIRLNQKK